MRGVSVSARIFSVHFPQPDHRRQMSLKMQGAILSQSINDTRGFHEYFHKGAFIDNIFSFNTGYDK